MHTYNKLMICTIKSHCSNLDTCDRLCINHPFTAKCNFWVQPKIAAMCAQDRYSSYQYGRNLQCTGYLVPHYEASTANSFSKSDAAASVNVVLAILCRITKRQQQIVSPRATLLLPLMGKNAEM